MNKVPSTKLGGWCLAYYACTRLALLLLVLAFFSNVVRAGEHRFGNPNFLIENWLEDDGLPESSAYAIAQTPDGYLWVGTADGIFRYNGVEFAPTGSGTNTPVLNGVIDFLYSDHAGRLWASTERGLGVRENGIWRTIRSTNTVARTMAEDASGLMLLGTADGRLYNIHDYQISPFIPPEGLTPSGVFCVADAQDGGIWLANRGFIGRLTPQGWLRLGPPDAMHNSLVATAARQGGLWVYTPGLLTLFSKDGTKQTFKARNLDQPRLLMEDREGAIWLASTTLGYVRLKPGETNGQTAVLATATAAKGLVHNSAWSLLQDMEGNYWLGSSCGGLSRLRPKYFQTIGVEDGLPNQIVRTVAEESPGHMIIGTHGRGTVRIHDGKVDSVRSPKANPQGDYAWSVLHDELGRTWIGTYEGGLLVETNVPGHIGTGTNEGGVLVETNEFQRSFPLPATLGRTINCLLEDSHKRIWIGTGTGLGYIEHDLPYDGSTNTVLAGACVRNLAEDTNSDAIWLGTYDSGLYRLQDHKFLHYGREEGLPGNRISSLLVDHDGYLWIGIFGKGLACLRDGRITLIGRDQGFPAYTAGSIVEDGLGWLWFGSDHGILRASEEQLHQAVQGEADKSVFDIFDSSDGLYSADCSEGFQPAATRDHAGRLWFATINGVVTVDPSKVQLNTNPPPVVIERVSYTDAAGTPHELYAPGTNHAVLPAGSVDLTFDYAALSLSAPEKNRFAYRLEGYNDNWVFLANRHALNLHLLPPGHYRLQVKASNNDHQWNETGASFNFQVAPFFWQTLWFRLLSLLGVAVGGGLAAWQLTLARVQRRIARLEEQRVLEQERARLAIVMDATNDLVAFADDQGNILHLNPAGYKLLGLAVNDNLSGLTLAKMNPAHATTLVGEGIAAAREHGTWEGETVLQHRDGHEIPVIQTIMTHRGLKETDHFLSTIARDITGQKLAEQASERLQSQLLQAQKMESVGRLAGGIAHDFNNMLQVILGNADLALEEATVGSQLHAELLEIQKSASRSAELTSQLLTFARKQIFRAQELNLNETVAGTSKMLQRLIGENIQLVLHPCSQLWPVRMDPSQVTQILANLAINARDAINGQGRLTIELSNVVLSQHHSLVDVEVVPGEYVLLSVKDNGQGMSREVLDHLFEPFFTTKEVGKGTGLGLATVFGIVKQNRGLIQVDSTPNQGTTFRLYFPRTTSTSMNNPPPPVTRQPINGTETILIVEDEENILHLVVLTLRKHGYQVVAATAPETAVNLAAAHPGKIDLLITDIVMPGMNGKELRDKISDGQPRMKSLFMSGYTAEIIAQHGDLEPGVNFLQKPFTIQNFLEKVRKTLDGQRAEDKR